MMKDQNKREGNIQKAIGSATADIQKKYGPQSTMTPEQFFAKTTPKVGQTVENTKKY